eukprot:m.239043 g.239043  ORF g.239043 m.239043 type:complete len:504 (+) comp13410_c0_seq1:13-1524(+)
MCSFAFWAFKMSLHDQLLADLEEVDEEDLAAEEAEEAEEEMEVADDLPSAMKVDLEALKESSVRAVAKLNDSQQLKRVLNAIEEFSAKPRKESYGPIEEDPEYKLIVESNNLTVEIENEINIIHKYVRDHYAKRFPELDQLVPIPLDYIRTVKIIQNEMEITKLNLSEILAPATIMVVGVAASTAQGSPLTPDELGLILEACDISLELDAARARIYEYVQSRMGFLAPNVSAICGASTAARIMGIAGGLHALAAMPACNILVLGATKRALSGFSSAAALPHTGFIYHSPLVQQQHPDIRRKAARLVAAKLALAARVDATSTGVDRKATVGIDLREELERKIEKALEPPPAKAEKALPAPDDAPRKKRGGRRFRAQKEKYGSSELRKQANRMNFGEIEEDIFQEEMGPSMGRAAKGAGMGTFRAPEAKTKGNHISKKLQKELQKSRHGGLSTIRGMSTNVAGTASVAFTPVAGLEIISPHVQEKPQAAVKYFSAGAGFMNIKKA